MVKMTRSPPKFPASTTPKTKVSIQNITHLGVAWMIKHLMELDEFNVNKLTNDMLRKFFDFLENVDYLKFFVWLNQEMKVEVSFDSAPKFFGNELSLTNFNLELKDLKPEDYQVCYFIKRSGKEVILIDKIAEHIICGQINNNPLDDLLNKMTTEYVPRLHGEQEWPEGVKKEFQANLNKFMAYLTEESAQMKGKTQLYIPEEHIVDIDVATKDKDLIQRLESTVIYWTR